MASACRPVCWVLFFFSPPSAARPRRLLTRSVNEQVDVRLRLQHHLLSDEETRLRRVLLRSVLQPHFRAAAAAGRRLPSSAKGNAATGSHLCPLLNGFRAIVPGPPRVTRRAGSIWPHAEARFILNLHSSTVPLTSSHTLSPCVK